MIVTLAGGQVEDRGEYVVARSPDNPTFWWGQLPRPPLAAAARGGVGLARYIRRGAADGRPSDLRARLGTRARGWTGHLGLRHRHRLAGSRTSAGFTSWSDSVPSPSRSASPCTSTPRRHTGRWPARADWAQLVELRCANEDDHEPAAFRVFIEASVRGIRRMVADGHGQWWGAFIGGRLLSTMGLFTDGSGVARYQNVDTHPDARRLGLAGTLAYRVGRWGWPSTAHVSSSSSQNPQVWRSRSTDRWASSTRSRFTSWKRLHPGTPRQPPPDTSRAAAGPGHLRP